MTAVVRNSFALPESGARERQAQERQPTPVPASAAMPSSPTFGTRPERLETLTSGTACLGLRSALGPCQWAVQPPSTGSATPVIEAAASPHRNTTVPAISSTVAKRFVGCSARKTLRITSSRLMPCAFA